MKWLFAPEKKMYSISEIATVLIFSGKRSKGMPVLFSTDTRNTWKLQAPTHVRMWLPAIDKEGYQSTTRDIESNQIPNQCWCHLSHWSTRTLHARAESYYWHHSIGYCTSGEGILLLERGMPVILPGQISYFSITFVQMIEIMYGEDRCNLPLSRMLCKLSLILQCLEM